MTQPEQHNDTELLQIPGNILEISTYDTFAGITDEDIQRIPETWARVMAERYKRLISTDELSND